MPMIDARLLMDVKAAEACRLTAYQDTLDNWTIGYGHKLPATFASHAEGYTITQEAANAMLVEDLAAARKACQELPEWQELNVCRENAVTELVFNMGYGHWVGFLHCRAALRAHLWSDAHDQLLASLWAKEVHAERATRLANYLRDGVYPGVDSTPATGGQTP